MKKILGYIYFPTVLIISIILGVPIGVLGKLIGNIEDSFKHIRRYIQHWKRYPKLGSLRYLEAYKRSTNRYKVSEMEALEESFQSGEKQMPHPLVTILLELLWFFSFTPFSLLAGIIEGPMNMYSGFSKWYKLNILKKSISEVYEESLEFFKEEEEFDE